MYVYIDSEKLGNGNWLRTVGFYKPDGTWVSESDHETEEAAAARVAYLNGGQDDEFDFNEEVQIVLRQFGLIS